jgi:hypothetical protein
MRCRWRFGLADQACSGRLLNNERLVVQRAIVRIHLGQGRRCLARWMHNVLVEAGQRLRQSRVRYKNARKGKALPIVNDSAPQRMVTCPGHSGACGFLFGMVSKGMSVSLLASDAASDNVVAGNRGRCTWN